MVILFMMQTGFKLDKANLDFHNQERAFKVTISKIFQMTKIKYKGKTCTAKSFWAAAPFINATKVIVGHCRAGICRRPIIKDDEWAKVVRVLIDLHAHSNTKETMGVNYKISIRETPTKLWTPSVLHKLYDEIDKRIRERKRSHEEQIKVSEIPVEPKESRAKGPCHFWARDHIRSQSGTNDLARQSHYLYVARASAWGSHTMQPVLSAWLQANY